MTDDQKLLVAAAAVVALLVLWFASMALRAVRNRRPHGKSVTRAAQTVLELDTGQRHDKVELTEHVAWLSGCQPPWPAAQAAVGKRGYLALTKTQLIFVPYHRADPVVLDRDQLDGPGSKHAKVWKKSRGSFFLQYRPEEEVSPVTLSFKVREPYTWMYHFGYRSGLDDDPFS